MDNNRLGLVVFTGSEREKICESIQNRIPLSCITAEKLEEFDEPEKIIFTVFCPRDKHELESMNQKAGEWLQFSDLLSTVILPFSPDSVTGFPLFLQESDFSFEVLRRIVCYAGMYAGEAVNLNRILWERAGSLLPFFLHNMNNILARIMGNVELAEFHSSRADKVKEKLSIALEGTEEMRNFLERLAIFSTTDDDKSEWTIGNEADILELGQMSSGTSVEFSYEEKSGMPRNLPVSKNLMNLLTGLIVASATISVNGVGFIEMFAAPRGGAVEFRIKWTSSSSKGSGVCPVKMDSAADLLTKVVLMAFHAGMSFKLNSWNSESGSASLLISVSHEDI
ncbi:MAG: hypothetical protein K8S15_00430 [Candidatus Aegiribacteria sp.]|nr:hypothetical protein [Candidatus Aegiribacteria sp.]